MWVGARMEGSESVQAPMSRRDNGDQAEYLEIELDTYLDRRTAYMFGVTASGVRLDHFHPVGGLGVLDRLCLKEIDERFGRSPDFVVEPSIEANCARRDLKCVRLFANVNRPRGRTRRRRCALGRRGAWWRRRAARRPLSGPCKLRTRRTYKENRKNNSSHSV